MSVDSKSPGRNRGIVLRCSHPTYLSIVADPFPRPLPVGRISISSPSYEREWEKTWDSYSKHGRSCRLSPIDTNERDFLHTLVRKRPLGLSRFETMPVAIGRALQPFPRSKPDVRLSPHPAFQRDGSGPLFLTGILPKP
jgi:hypothetical protein